MSSKTDIRAILAAGVWLALATAAVGQTAANLRFLARAQTAAALAQKNYLADTNSTTAASRLARSDFTVADLATNETQRAEFARRGIEVCRTWLAREPKSGAGHYYLAMSLGELAQAEAPSIAAYKLVHEVEREFKLATELDVTFDHAGPARNLGELYFQAPGWPLSVGNKHQAREWLERAAALAPDFPENQINLAEAHLKWHQPEAFAATVKKLETVWPAARTNLAGEDREADWADWSTRRAALKVDGQKAFGAKP